MIWNPLKSLKPWQVLALFVVVLAAAGATYGGYLRAGERESTALEESQQIIPIRYGNLVNEVSTSGNLAFPDRVTLSFGSGGSVAELAVEEGTPVSRGQVLARLDDLAIASLAEAKAKAELSRLEAVEALEEAMTVDPLAIAEAQENIAAARLAVQDAEEALEDARNPHTREDIEKQRQLAADTELQLQNTRQALADMATAHETQLAKTREAAAAARFDHEEARRKLEDFAPSHNLAAIAARQSVADAEADLDAALQSLADFDPNYARSLALARQEKADAAVDVENARSALGDFRLNRQQQLAESGDAKAAAETALQEKREALDDLESNHSLNVIQARQSVADARDASIKATASLENYETSNSRRLDTLFQEKEEFETGLAEARAKLAELKSARDGGVNGLDLAIHKYETAAASWEEALAPVKESLAEWELLTLAQELAQRELDDAIAELARLETGPDSLAAAEMKAALELAQTRMQTAEAELLALEADDGADRLAQLEAALATAQDAHSRATAELARMESDTDSAEFRQLEAKAETARSRVDEARRELEDLTAPAAPEIISAWQSRVSRAQAAKETPALAQGILSALSNGADAVELALLEARLASTQNDLDTALREVERLSPGPDALEMAAQKAEEARLAAALAQARDDLAELLRAPDETGLAAKEASIVLAKAELADAEAALAELMAGPDPVETAALEARVEAAAQEVKDAASLLDRAVLRAPFGGFVSQVMVEEGDEAQPRTDIVEVVDPSVIEVDGIVDEIDVLSVRLGVPVRVTLDALPGETIDGTVTRISPGARNQQGVVTYPITIQLGPGPGVELREGLSAVASIVLWEERDVLLAPRQALYGTFDQPVVKAVNADGSIQERPVTLGASDEFWVSIEDGLQEGDRVAMEAPEVGTSQFSFRQFRRSTGGGPPSRGGRR